MITAQTSYLLMALASLIAAGLLMAGVFPRRRWAFILGGLVGIALSVYVAYENVAVFGRRVPVWVFVASAIGVPMAIVLILKGVKGKRLGDHPHCRACGFDLFGKPESTAVCNECGIDLREPKNTVIGIRKRRGGLVFAGLFMLIFTGSVITPSILPMLREVDWNTYKPEFWLLANVEAGDGAAFAEATDRFLVGRLSKASTSRLIQWVAKLPVGSKTIAMNFVRAQTSFQRLVQTDQQAILRMLGPYVSPRTPTQIAAGRSFAVSFPVLDQPRLVVLVSGVEVDNVTVSIDGKALPPSTDPPLGGPSRSAQTRLFSTAGLSLNVGQSVSFRLQYTEVISGTNGDGRVFSGLQRDVDETFTASVVAEDALDCPLAPAATLPQSPPVQAFLDGRHEAGPRLTIVAASPLCRLDRFNVVKEGKVIYAGAVYINTYAELKDAEFIKQFPFEVILTPAPDLGYQRTRAPLIDPREVRIPISQIHDRVWRNDP